MFHQKIKSRKRPTTKLEIANCTSSVLKICTAHISSHNWDVVTRLAARATTVPRNVALMALYSGNNNNDYDNWLIDLSLQQKKNYASRYRKTTGPFCAVVWWLIIVKHNIKIYQRPTSYSLNFLLSLKETFISSFFLPRFDSHTSSSIGASKVWCFWAKLYF